MKKLLHLFALSIFITSCSNNSKTEADFKLIPVKSGNYWGYIDREGQIKINPQFAYANPFYEGLALIKASDGKYGYINEEGKYIINATYKQASDFANGMALVVKENSKLEFINSKGETKINLDPSIEMAHNFREGLALVSINNKFGYINDEGKIVIPSIYADAEDFSDGLARVAQYDSINDETKYGFINNKGEIIINYQFEIASSFKDGFSLVSNGTQYGYIGNDGKFIINPQFDNVTLFAGNYAAIRQGDLYGFIDKKGKIVINPQFKSVDLFYDNDLAAVVSTDGKHGFIDKEGKYIINAQFDYASRFYNDMSIIKTGQKFGMINKKGKITVNPQFDAINMGNSNNYQDWVLSDYFDVSDVVSYILESVTAKSFNGFSGATTFNNIRLIYPNINEANYYNFTDFVSKENRNIRLKIIGTSYKGGLTIYRENYTTQQVYDPVAGGYTTQQVYAGSESTLNPNALLNLIAFRYSLNGKAQNKKAEIVKALSDALKTRGMTDLDPYQYEGEFGVKNKNYSVVVSAEDGDDYLTVTVNFDVSMMSSSAPVADTTVAAH